MTDPTDADRADEDAAEGERPKPIIPPRKATPQQALFGIVLVFFVGVVLGFALAKGL